MCLQLSILGIKAAAQGTDDYDTKMKEIPGHWKDLSHFTFFSRIFYLYFFTISAIPMLSSFNILKLYSPPVPEKLDKWKNNNRQMEKPPVEP